MKSLYKFNNLLGTVYNAGDIIFSNDGTSIISPVGNRITIYDLKNNKSTTLSLESKYNYNAMDLSPNGYTLVAVNEEGEAHFVSMISMMVIYKYRFKGRIANVKFSPDGKHIAISKENKVFLFKFSGDEFENYKPFIMERIFTGATDDVTCIQWSFDSKMLAVGSKDKTPRLHFLEKCSNFKTYTFTNHSDVIIGCYFEKDNYDLSTISRNGHLCVWKCSIAPIDLTEHHAPWKMSKTNDMNSDDEDDIHVENVLESTLNEENYTLEFSDTGKNVTKVKINENKIQKLKYQRLARYYLADCVKSETNNIILSASSYHAQNHILVVGFNNGSFFLYELPSVNLIHSLSIANECISAISINSTGDWIALGCSEAGQLLVWEWQSESYSLKQQGHANNMTSLHYSPNGQYIVTGGDDGKVKLWKCDNGFCVATFQEHSSSISGITFSHNQKFIASASLDGTVRAYDLIRYRNFKTFTSLKPVQFSCLALNASDEFLAAGGQNIFEIYLWNVQTGCLLEILSGHEGPVVSLAFNPNPASTTLASASWDKTLRLWNAIESNSNFESVQLTSDALCVAFKPDGKEIAVATLDGQIAFFDCKTSLQMGYIEGRKDLGGGRSVDDLITAQSSLNGKYFSCLCYSSDGSCIIAGGLSKNVCMYNVQESILLKTFEITQNRSLDSVNDFINRRKLTAFGYGNLIEERENSEGGNIKIRLPGVRSGDMAKRGSKPEIRVFDIQFSPLGQSWAAATTEGLLIYSWNPVLLFNPYELDIEVTPDAIKNALEIKDYSKALTMALKLNEISKIRQVIESISHYDMTLILLNLSEFYLEKLLLFLVNELETTKHMEFYIQWIDVILNKPGKVLNTLTLIPVFLMLQKNSVQKLEVFRKMCDFNLYTMKYLTKIGERKAMSKTAVDRTSVV